MEDDIYINSTIGPLRQGFEMSTKITEEKELFYEDDETQKNLQIATTNQKTGRFAPDFHTKKEPEKLTPCAVCTGCTPLIFLILLAIFGIIVYAIVGEDADTSTTAGAYGDWPNWGGMTVYSAYSAYTEFCPYFVNSEISNY